MSLQAMMTALQVVLQDMTNALFFRKVLVGFTVEHKKPAVVIQVKTLRQRAEFRCDPIMFLKIVRDVLNMTSSDLTDKGFTIPKAGKMERDFILPKWAFPKLELELMMAGSEITKMLKEARQMQDTVISNLRSLGIPEEEIKKYQDAVGKTIEGITAPKDETIH